MTTNHTPSRSTRMARRTLTAVALTLTVTAVLLTGCTPAAGITRTVASPPNPTGTAAPTRAAGAPAIRAVRSPGVVVDDMHNAPGTCHARVKDAAAGLILPDPACTPGGIDPAVTQANIHQTICVPGYTKTVRPPADQTDAAKRASLAAYGEQYARSTEEDHLIPLSLGSTNDTANLWAEPNRQGATSTLNPKDAVEDDLHRAVCAGRVTLAAAQQAIATDWTTAEATLGLTR